MRTKSEKTMADIVDFVQRYTRRKGYAPTNKEIASGVGLAQSTAHKYVTYLIERGDLWAGERKRGIQVQRFPRGIFGAGNDFFILRAHGDSMIDAGIDDGDRVVIRRQSTADDGDIVVALVEGETTLKRFYRDKRRKRFCLHPENAAYPDLYCTELQVQGVAVTVWKDL